MEEEEEVKREEEEIRKNILTPLKCGQRAASQHQPWQGPVYSLGHTTLSPRMMHPQEQYPEQL